MIWFFLSAPILLSFLQVVSGRDVWERLLGFSSLSTKVVVLIYVLSFLLPELYMIRDVAFFYLFTSGGGVLLFSYFLGRRKG